jgi:hypothetical protein
MALALRSYRYSGKSGWVTFSECADRNRVMVTMKSGPVAVAETLSMFLTRENWDCLRTFDPLNDARRPRKDSIRSA